MEFENLHSSWKIFIEQLWEHGSFERQAYAPDVSIIRFIKEE